MEGERRGKTRPAACREAGITEQTYCRWRKEYGGLKVVEAALYCCGTRETARGE